jgi:multicomponent Na+:H+ antiporter subunit D
VASVTGFAVAVYALADVDEARRRAGFTPLLLVLLMGVCTSFLTGDIFNLYVCFEVMLIASFVLLALGGERPQMEGALKYVTLNLVSSAIFLAAVGVLYGLTGTLNMAHLARLVPVVAESHPELITAVAGLFLASFGIKAGIFPLYFWLPASYHTPPVAVSAVFAGLLTKVGVYALIRVFTLIFAGVTSLTNLILILAGLTMLTGVLGAVSQYHIRRILSFHIISQIGYMVMGLGLLAAPDPEVRRIGLLAAVFYIVHHIIVKTNLFLIGGIVRRLRGRTLPAVALAGGALSGSGPQSGRNPSALGFLGEARDDPGGPGGRGLAGGGRRPGRRRDDADEHDEDLERGLLEAPAGRPAAAGPGSRGRW